jgi:hypothetical protein
MTFRTRPITCDECCRRIRYARQTETAVVNIALPLLAGIAGVVIGAFLSRRNARQDHADKLLADALNDLVAAVAEVANGDQTAQRRYASATSRIVLHGSPELVEAFCAFQVGATTADEDGRRRFKAAVQTARREFGRKPVSDEAATVLLFGPDSQRDIGKLVRQPGKT